MKILNQRCPGGSALSACLPSINPAANERCAKMIKRSTSWKNRSKGKAGVRKHLWGAEMSALSFEQERRIGSQRVVSRIVATTLKLTVSTLQKR